MLLSILLFYRGTTRYGHTINEDNTPDKASKLKRIIAIEYKSSPFTPEKRVGFFRDNLRPLVREWGVKLFLKKF